MTGGRREIISHTLAAGRRAAGNISTFLGVAMIGIIWLGATFHLTTERQIFQEAAIQNSGNLARAFEEHLVRSIKEVDRVLLLLRENYEKNPAVFDFANWKESEYFFSDIAATRVGIIGVDGLLRQSNAGVPSASVDLRDREHFQVHINAAYDELFIGKPVISQRTTEWVIPLTRRLRNRDGSFGGVIAATIDTSYFTRFYNAINLGSEGAIALIGLTDGVFRASENPVRDLRGETLTDFLAYLSHLTAPEGWYFSDAAWSDGVKRLTSYRKIKEFPLVVMVGISDHYIFASTTFKQQTYYHFVILSTALILLVVAFNIRNEDKLARTRSALHSQNLQFDTALNNMSQGLCMFDAEKRLVVCNDRYAKMYQLPPELLKVGTPHNVIIAHRVSHGLLKGERDDGAVQQKLLALSQLPAGTRSGRIDELADGRLICVTREPMEGGGWVATHEDITERNKAETQIAYMAHHDPLTGLLNRTRFGERLEEALTQVQRGGQLAVLLLDLDHFKQVNDTAGHLIGDEVLKAVADRLRGCVRETDTVARLSGDEFAIIQTAIEQPTDISALADRIQATIKAPFDLVGLHAAVDVSIGISLAPNDATNSTDLMKQADMALYKAKTDGRGTYRFFESEMDTRMKARRKLETDLRNAIVNGGFELFYQPVVNLRNDEVVGLEALLRWHHPERGMISPVEFVSAAEESGLIIPLGEWVLTRACSDAANWPDNMKVAVNLSPVQFRSRNLVQTVIGALAASGVEPCRLELELTEAALLSHNRDNLAVLDQLRKLGVRIVMDDFGTGYSSLNYLRSFPFDKIKIDRSFVSDLSDGNDVSFAIVGAVVALARALNVPTVAEGVETKAQLELIRAAGCTEFQGYLFSPPRPVEEINALLASRTEGAASAA
jgi:diguanylate cyclase (GGDEF)-like protein